MAGSKILIVDANAASRKFVAEALQKDGHHILQAASGKEGLIVAWRDRPEVIIIDPVMFDLKGEDFAIRLRSDERTSRVFLIALSSDPLPARIRSCMDAGFNEYLVKTAQAIPVLMETVSRVLGDTAAAKEGGLLIVFLSAKGGTGTSSLCANIAMNIARNQPEARVVVADLVLPIGSIAGIVGYESKQNLVTIADMPAPETTPEFFREHLTALANWHFHLLAGSPDPENGSQLKVGRIGDIVEALKASYDFILLDLGRSLSWFSQPLIEHADLIAMVVSTDLGTVTLTKTVWEYLRSKGVQAALLYTILNRAVGLEGLTKAEAEKIIGVEIKMAMPYLGGNFSLANNLHQPITLKFPQDTASVVLKEASQQMVDQARRLRAK
ncbi:MAG: response regulator [Chloroflexi bacterium]|nr:response regulator [Chloroflexota bacterium]